MPRSSGSYTLPAGNPVVTGTTVSASVHNATMSDIGAEITNSLPRDGSVPPTANIPMGGYKLTGMGSGSARTDSITLGQAQDSAYSYLTSVAGTNTITATLATPSLAAYAAGQMFHFIPANDNTGAATININGIGAKNIYFEGAALTAGRLKANIPAVIIHDGTQFNLIGAVLSLGTAFTTEGTSPAFTVTTSPAYGAYAANQRMRVKFHSAGTTGSNTLNRDGLGAKNLMQYDATGTKVSAVVAVNQLTDVEYDGTDMVILDPLPTSGRQIQPITASVAANALTLTLNPTTLDFRSSTLSNGAINTLTVASAISMTVSSGSTLGTVSGQQARIALLAIDNSGTVELACVNLSGGNNLDETTLISTTSEGGAGAADSANVIYSTTGRINVPFRVVGFIDITETTAGTWATAPTKIQGQGGQALNALNSLGYGQTWQSVARTNGTTYYNTTGKPIVVSAWGNVSGNLTGYQTLTIVVSGVLVANARMFLAAEVNSCFCTAIVPPGASYVVTLGGSYNSLSVAELR